jgi:hypothetical protein
MIVNQQSGAWVMIDNESGQVSQSGLPDWNGLLKQSPSVA